MTGDAARRGYARAIRSAIVIATVALVVVFAVPARAATPVAPASGSSFASTDTVIFKAEPAADDSDYWFQFSTSKADYDAGYGLSFGHRGDELDLDLDWLAWKANHIGTYWWGVCPLIVKGDRHSIQSARPVNMHHEGDLLSQAATAPIGRFSPAQEVILRSTPDGTNDSGRWIEA